MPKPHKFESKKELLIALPRAKQILDDYLKQPLKNENDFVNVDKNTIRAFPLRKINTEYKIGPLALYKQTVSEIFKHRFEEFSKLKTENSYSDFIVGSARSIEKIFDSAAKKEGFMGFGRAAKLFNLTCKAMLRSPGIKPEDLKILSGLAHVPFDSYTLQGICKLETPFKIPPNSSMGWTFMNDIQKYLTLQKWVKELCAEADCLALHYEIIAWDAAH
jgi:hypothetical protein